MFWIRLGSSAVLVVLALITILAGGWVLLGTLYLISLIAYWELARACGFGCGENGKRPNALFGTGCICITLYYLVIGFTKHLLPASFGPAGTIFVLLFGFMAMMFVYVFSFPKYEASQVMSAFFCLVYAPVMFSFVYMTRQLPYGVYIVWMIFIASWICDTCAYVVGMTLGRHKLAPLLSPKKSVEGAVGGVLGSALVGALFGWLFVERVVPEVSFTWGFALIGALGAVISQVGDLAASAIKRNHQIKDYGKLIPGHGGIMDRFDSVIFAAPMIYFLALALSM